MPSLDRGRTVAQGQAINPQFQPTLISKLSFFAGVIRRWLFVGANKRVCWKVYFNVVDHGMDDIGTARPLHIPGV